MKKVALLVMLASLGPGCGGSKGPPPKPASAPVSQPLVPGKAPLPPEQADEGVKLRAIDGTVHLRKAGEHPYLPLLRARQRIGKIYENQEAVILKGVPSLYGEWPWAVALVDVWGSTAFLACGGALIADEWVLTAAHCDIDVQDDAIVGANDLAAGEGTRVDVASVCVHPGFDPTSLDWDVALVKIAQPLSAQQKMKRTAGDPRWEAPGTSATAIGWGWIDDQGNYTSVLQKVSIPVVADPTCSAAYPGMVTPRMLCAGDYDKGGCDGDSGGPLMVQDDQTMEWLEVGIVSWGSACTRPDLFGVYSRVSQINQWIDLTLASTQPECKVFQ